MTLVAPALSRNVHADSADRQRADLETAVRLALLTAIRVHRIRLELALGDTDMLRVALERGCITPAQAIASMADMGIELPAAPEGRAAA